MIPLHLTRNSAICVYNRRFLPARYLQTMCFGKENKRIVPIFCLCTEMVVFTAAKRYETTENEYYFESNWSQLGINCMLTVQVNRIALTVHITHDSFLRLIHSAGMCVLVLQLHMRALWCNDSTKMFRSHSLRQWAQHRECSTAQKAHNI